MKFRCNLCLADPDQDSPYTVVAIDWDAGMAAMQEHMNAFHDGGVAVAQDATVNVKVRL